MALGKNGFWRKFACGIIDRRKRTRGTVALSKAVFEALEPRIFLTTVTNTNDSGAGSLRAAILAANGGGDQTIIFDLTPTLTSHTITLTSGALTINDTHGPLTIEGFGQSQLIIDGNANDSVFDVVTGSVVLENLAIINGAATNGAGILNSGTLSLNDCTISGNTATQWGGGIYNKNGYLAINNSTIINNYAAGQGGGIYSAGGVTIGDSTISGNTSGSWGGGFYSYYGNDSIANSNISGNHAYAGGGIYTSKWNTTSLSITNSTISGNTATTNGGGIFNASRYSYSGYAGTNQTQITNSTITGNIAGGNGGGIALYSYYGTSITNSTIAGNKATGGGGGIYNISNLTLTNSTIFENFGGNDGGGVFTNNTADIIDCTIYGNVRTPGTTGDASGIFASGTTNLIGTLVMAHIDGSDISGTVTGSYNLVGDGTGGLSSLNHNLTGSGGGTFLADLGYYGGPTQTTALLSGSTAIGHGAPSSISGVTTDQRGFTRTSTPDIGAFQTQTNPFVVNTTSDDPVGPNQMSLRDAINLTKAMGGNDTITFDSALTSSGSATINLNGNPLTPVGDTLTIQGPTVHQLTIDAQGNSGVFVINSFSSSKTIINNLTITGGSATNGGGIKVTGHAQLVLNDSVVTGNVATSAGGGIYGGATSTVTIEDTSTVSLNSAENGGGIATKGSLTISDSTISGNSVSGLSISAGGGVYGTATSTVTISSSSTVSGNTASLGGGIGNEGSLTLSDSTISGNHATALGGGIYSTGSFAITNSTISGNSSSDNGAGIFKNSSSTSTINDSYITTNTAGLTGGGIWQGNGSLSIVGSTISGNSAAGGGGIYNGYLATLSDCTLSGNIATTGSSGGAVYNDFYTTLTNCTFSYNSAAINGGAVHNNGFLVLSNSTFDHNSASNNGGALDTPSFFIPTSIADCTFTDNSAQKGGAIAGSISLANSTLTGNTASQKGGAIYNYYDSTGTLTNCTFSGNSATTGPAIYNANAALLVLAGTVQTSLLGSISDDGGTVQLAGTVNLSGGTLSLSSANVGGSLQMSTGALILDGTIQEVSGTNLVVNSSQTVGLDGVTVNGTGTEIDESPSSSKLVITDGLTFSGTLLVGNSTLKFANTETISGGTIYTTQSGSRPEGAEGGSIIAIATGATVTLGTGTTLKGGAKIESTSGDPALINEGSIIPIGVQVPGNPGSGDEGFILSSDVSFTNQGMVAVSGLAAFSTSSQTLVGAAMAISPTEILFGWAGLPMNSGDTYAIKQSTDGTTFTTIATTLPAGNYDVVEGLQPNTTYYYEVEETSSSGAKWIYSSEPVSTNLNEPDDYASAYQGTTPIVTKKDQFGFYAVSNIAYAGGGTVPTSQYNPGVIPAGSAEGAFLTAADGLVSTGVQNGEVMLPYAVTADDGEIILGDLYVQPISAPTPYFTTYLGPGQETGKVPPQTGSPSNPGGGDPIQYATGATEIYDSILSSSAFGSIWGVTLNWTAQDVFVPDSTLGNGWMNQNQTYLQDMAVGSTNPNILLVRNANDQTIFISSGGTYSAFGNSNDGLTHNTSDNTYTWLNATTFAQSTYYDFTSSNAANLQGKLKQYQDAGGNQVNFIYNSAGQLTTVTQNDTAGDTQTFSYTYTNNQVSLIQQFIQRAGDSGPTLIRQASFAYYQGTYSGDDAFGNLGDLKTVKVEDGDGNELSENYYRYYTPNDLANGAQGFVGGLAYRFVGDSFIKLSAKFSDPFSATNTQVLPYADEFYAYDTSRRVSQEIVGSEGASNSLGQGTYSFSYYFDPGIVFATANFNTWITRTTETRPDGNKNVVYTNVLGDGILDIQNVSSDPGNSANVGGNWILGYEYDTSGRLIKTIAPSAIDLSASFLGGATSLSGIEAAIEPYANLGMSIGLISSTQGLIDDTTYYSSTTGGGVLGFIEADYVQQGLSGTPIEQDLYTYTSHTNAAGFTVYPVATYTKYQSSASGGSTPETTTFTYNDWQSNSSGTTNQVQDETITNPTVTTAQHGSNSATTAQIIYSTFGQPVWAKDANGFITYTAYDNVTGAIIETVEDVKTSDLSDLKNYAGTTFTSGYNTYGVPQLPSSGWSTPTGGGLNLVTTDFVDNLGRTIEEISPAGNITLFVYDDVHHATFTLPGVVLNTSSNTLTTTGPITMVRTEIPYAYSSGGQTLEGLYNETITFSVNTSISYTGGFSGQPIIPELTAISANVFNLTGSGTTSSPQFTIQSLTRDLYNNAGLGEGQLVETDDYAVISNATYLATSSGGPYSGSQITNQLSGQTPNGNYYVTSYAYDLDGRNSRTIDANGTIDDIVYDSMDRPVAEWIGTNDATSGTLSYFDGSNAGSGNNMTKVQSFVYDNRGIGDGNLTETVQYPNGNTTGTQDVTIYSYDFSDREIAAETGLTLNSSDAATTSSTDPYPQITVWTLDNLGDILATLTFNGGAVSLTTAISDAASATAGATITGLFGFSTSQYDSQNEDFEDQTYSVDPSSGAISSAALTAYTFYDSNGNVIETIDPSGLVTKNVYDGVGDLVETFVTDGGAVNNSGGLSPLLTYSAASSESNDVVVEQVAYGYDADGNLIEIVDAQRLNTDSTSATGTPFSYTVNSNGSLDVTANSSIGSRIDYTASYYDQADRDIADVNLGTNTPTFGSVPSRSGSIQEVTYGYDAAGNQDTTTDSNGNVTRSYFDALGRMTKTIADYTDGTPRNYNNRTTEYIYDGGSDITSETAVMPNGTADQITDYIYGVTTAGGSTINSNDLLGEVEYPNPSTGAAGASSSDDETYTYDALGELTSRKDRNGTRHTYAYDSQGRLLSDTAVVATGNPQNIDTTVTKLTYSYNNQGLPFEQTSLNSSNGVVNQVENIYNGLGQLISQYQGVSGAVTSSTPEVQYFYSSLATGSRLTEMDYPNGRKLFYGYDNNSLDNAIGRVDFLADANSSGGVGPHDVDYQYLGLSTIISQAQGNGVTETTTLNALREIAEMKYVNSGSTTLDDFQYGYDANGNVLFELNGVNTSLSQLYAYDNLNRVTSYEQGTLNSDHTAMVGTPGSTQSWGYDALGNQLSMTINGGTPVTSSYNDQNQFTSNTYDKNGNMVADGNNTYIYDAWNHLIAVKNSSGATIAAYTYNADAERVTETHGSTTVNVYFSDDWQEIEDRQGSTVTAQYLWGLANVNDLVLRDDNSVSGNLGISGSGLGERLYAQKNLTWNVTSITDSSGNVAERFTYLPYGSMTVLTAGGISTTDAHNWTYLYQGGKLDTAIGLYNFRFRDLNTSFGTWMNQEPLGATYIDGTNLYQFGQSNPIMYVDPLGLRGVLTEPPPTEAPIGAPGSIWGSGAGGESIGILDNPLDAGLAVLALQGIQYDAQGIYDILDNENYTNDVAGQAYVDFGKPLPGWKHNPNAMKPDRSPNPTTRPTPQPRGLTITNANKKKNDTTKPSPPPKPSKADSPVWQGLKPYKGKTKTNGENGSKRRYYEWDHTHGDIEVYDGRGNHLGTIDPITGQPTKPPVRGRKINP